MNVSVLNVEGQNMHLHTFYINFSLQVVTWTWVAEAGVKVALGVMNVRLVFIIDYSASCLYGSLCLKSTTTNFLWFFLWFLRFFFTWCKNVAVYYSFLCFFLLFCMLNPDWSNPDPQLGSGERNKSFVYVVVGCKFNRRGGERAPGLMDPSGVLPSLSLNKSELKIHMEL